MKSLRSLNPTVLLICLGVITAAAYAAIVYLFPLSLVVGASRPYDLEQFSRGRQWAAGVYVVGLLLAFGAFAAAFPLVARIRKPLPLILGFGLLFALILFWIYPVTAIDVFAYVLQGRLEVLHHLNPLTAVASQAPTDPLLPFIGEWKDTPSPYGPLWALIASGIVRLGFMGTVDGVLVFKLLALITYAGGLLIVLWGARRSPAALLLFAWNPLVLLQGPAHAHNDLLMIVTACLGLVLWERRRWWAAGVLLITVGALVKAPALLLGPILLIAVLRREPSWGRRVLVFGATAVLGLAVVAVAYLPYWPPWESMIGLAQAFATQKTYTLLSLVRLSLTRLGVPAPYDFQGPRLFGLLVFHVCYLTLLWRVWKGRKGTYTAAFWTFFLYLFTSTSYRIWYPLWVVLPAALAYGELRDELQRVRLLWRTGLLSLTSELSILMFTLLWRWVLNGTAAPKADWFWMHLITTPWQFGLPLLLPLLIRRGSEPRFVGFEDGQDAGAVLPTPRA